MRSPPQIGRQRWKAAFSGRLLPQQPFQPPPPRRVRSQRFVPCVFVPAAAPDPPPVAAPPVFVPAAAPGAPPVPAAERPLVLGALLSEHFFIVFVVNSDYWKWNFKQIATAVKAATRVGRALDKIRNAPIKMAVYCDSTAVITACKNGASAEKTAEQKKLQCDFCMSHTMGHLKSHSPLASWSNFCSGNYPF